MLHVMVDLETMGVRPGSAITSIGAAAFTAHADGTYEFASLFHARISLESAVRAGLTMDASTVVWWLAQAPEAREETQAPDKSSFEIQRVLSSFSNWLQENVGRDYDIYGNSAAFDLGLLGAAYDAVKIKRPWSYRQERCYRTLKLARPDIAPPEFTGTRHNALADATHQAKHCAAILAAIGGVP